MDRNRLPDMGRCNLNAARRLNDAGTKPILQTFAVRTRDAIWPHIEDFARGRPRNRGYAAEALRRVASCWLRVTGAGFSHPVSGCLCRHL